MTVRTQEWVACSDVEDVLATARIKVEILNAQVEALKAANYRHSTAGLIAECTGLANTLNDLLSELQGVADSSEYGTLMPKARPE